MNNRQVSVVVTVSYLNADSAVTAAKRHGAKEEAGPKRRQGGVSARGVMESGGHCN